MKIRLFLFFGSLLLMMACPTLAQAEYRSRSTSGQAEDADSFEEAIDLRRFRKGNIAWDTQELIASGFKALHEEHLRLTQAVRALQTAVNELRGER